MWYVMLYIDGVTQIDPEYPSNKSHWRIISKAFTLREKAEKDMYKRKEGAPECTYMLVYLPR